MAIFRRKEKEQHLVPHTHVEQPLVTPHIEVPVAAPVAPEQQRSFEQQQPAQQEQQHVPEVPKPGARATQATDTPAPVVPAAPVGPAKSETRKQIETVLSEGLTKVYQSMTPEEQKVFREAGEKAATQIEQQMGTFKATARVVLDLIRQWLMLIPRVNRYFLEQESKIKTDRMMTLQRKLKKMHRQTHIRME